VNFPQRTTEAQNRLAFRFAVKACLEDFYREPAAESIVSAWWGRISKTSAFKSGYFMHSEPISTAARLIDKTVVELSAEDEVAYEQLKEDAFRRAIRTNDKESAKGATEVDRDWGSRLKTEPRTPPQRAVASPRPKRALVAKQA
jgi:hypothetical protein